MIISLRTHLPALTAALVTLSLSPAADAAELSGSPDELREYLRSETRTVTIRDEATETAYTDVAEITLVVSTEARTLASAMEQNNNLRDSVFQKLVSAGIDADRIQSSKYSASPQFGWFGDTPNSFEVVNTLTVTVDEDTLFRRVAEISDSDKAIRFAGAKFEHSGKEEYEDRVRDKAVNAVLGDKEYFENKLGLRLTPVSFNFSDVFADQYGGFGMLEEVVVTANRAASSRPAPKAPASSFDEVEYRVSVSITFAVERPE